MVKRDKNHEGYHDPTACEAIRRTRKRRNRGRKRAIMKFKIGETEAFCEAVNSIQK